ncbi:MAG: hypothetical protein JSU68_06325 [Phycisphaerales bacterium]|nr:MAG: hypothetical protein JSU68_06325 [Phycisphaerales bacterium]
MTAFSDRQYVPPASPGTVDAVGDYRETDRWIEFARAGCAVPGSKREQAGELVCGLPFNLAVQDRHGQERVHMVRSHSLSDHAVVLFSRQKMRLYDEVRLQLDDGTDRAWVRARVTQNTNTVGGHLVRLECVEPAAVGV